MLLIKTVISSAILPLLIHISIISNAQILSEKDNKNYTLFNEKRFQSNGFQSQFETINGLSTKFRASSGIRFINGYKFRDKYFGGIGVGGLIHHKTWGRQSVSNYKSYPLFLRLSYDIKAKRNTPFFFSDIGVNLDPDRHRYLKPIFFRCGLGNKMITKRCIIYINTAYSYNKTRDYYSYWNAGRQYKYSDWYNAHTFEISFGMQFN